MSQYRYEVLETAKDNTVLKREEVPREIALDGTWHLIYKPYPECHCLSLIRIDEKKKRVVVFETYYK